MNKDIKGIEFSFILIFFCFFYNTATQALPFKITPKEGTTLPTRVPANGTTYAFYTIQNMSDFARTKNTIKNLPTTVTQVTTAGFYDDTCSMPFDLQAHGSSGDSCTLQLVVSGVTNGFPKPFVCLQSSPTSCVGTPNPLVVSVFTLPTYNWETTTLSGALYISDLAITADNLYAGGLVAPISGQVWQFLLPSWTPQYTTPTYASKVTGMIPTADNSALYITAGNIGYGTVDIFTPGQTAPSDITGTFTPSTQTLNDLALGDSNVLYAAGATSGSISVGEVWRWNGAHAPLESQWTGTQLNSFGLSPAFWLSYVPALPNSFSPQGLYVAAYITPEVSDNPAVYRYAGSPTPVWSNTFLPENYMDSLYSLNVDSSGTLYAAGSHATSGVTRGAIARYNGSSLLWEPIAAPPDAQTINIMSFATIGTDNYYFLGGNDTNTRGTVWIGNGQWWINTALNGTGLTEAEDITSLIFSHGTLYAGGFDNGEKGAVWSLNAIQ